MHIQELLRHRMAKWPWVWERGARYMVTRSRDSSTHGITDLLVRACAFGFHHHFLPFRLQKCVHPPAWRVAHPARLPTDGFARRQSGRRFQMGRCQTAD